MNIDPTSRVRDLAVSVPGATAIFERFHIDYCCRGGNSLGEACAAAGVPVDKIQEEIERVSTERTEPTTRWEDESLAALVAYIVQRHHTYTREALDRLGPLSMKVASVHGGRHSFLPQLAVLVRELDGELRPHLVKEEHVLFPYIEKLEASARAGRPASIAPFGSIENPVRMMMLEHDHCGDLLREMRGLTSDYGLPADACASFTALYEALQALEKDLHEHIHLESNILFPRAVALEEGA